MSRITMKSKFCRPISHGGAWVRCIPIASMPIQNNIMNMTVQESLQPPASPTYDPFRPPSPDYDPMKPPSPPLSPAYDPFGPNEEVRSSGWLVSIHPFALKVECRLSFLRKSSSVPMPFRKTQNQFFIKAQRISGL